MTQVSSSLALYDDDDDDGDDDDDDDDDDDGDDNGDGDDDDDDETKSMNIKHDPPDCKWETPLSAIANCPPSKLFISIIIIINYQLSSSQIINHESASASSSIIMISITNQDFNSPPSFHQKGSVGQTKAHVPEKYKWIQMNVPEKYKYKYKYKTMCLKQIEYARKLQNLKCRNTKHKI